MVVEVDDSSVGRVLKFNGTTEWALDIVESGEALWLPREDQLRGMLGRHFVALVVTPGGYVVVVDHDGQEQRHEDLDVECAYARAVLSPARCDQSGDESRRALRLEGMCSSCPYSLSVWSVTWA